MKKKKKRGGGGGEKKKEKKKKRKQMCPLEIQTESCWFSLLYAHPGTTKPSDVEYDQKDALPHPPPSKPSRLPSLPLHALSG